MKGPRLLLAVFIVGAILASIASEASAAVQTCFGKMATMVGTPGNDRLIGTAGNDVIVGRAGRDTIVGREATTGSAATRTTTTWPIVRGTH